MSKIDMLPLPETLNLDSPASSDGIRVLSSEEIKSVEHIFLSSGNALPDPAVSQFIGAVKDGKVVAFLVLQLKLHAEPMWISEGNSQLFLPLVRAAEKIILNKVGPQWVYLFAPAGRVAQLATSIGMQVEPYVIMSKLVTPELPTKPAMDLGMNISDGETIQ